jgi:hypothetical protein
VFGVGHRARRLPGGRKAKRWFKACQPEYQALRAAVARGDTEAAKEARRVFNCKKRREQRRLAAVAQAEHLRDIKHNPRRFWTGYKHGPSQPSLHDMAALTEHWQSLYGVSGCGGLPESAPSVEGLVQQLQSEATPAADPAADDELSAEISVEEVEAAVRKLRYGRTVGPDGLRGEFLKGLYVRHEYWCPEQQRMLVKHVYDTQPGSVLGELCELLNAAFGGAVPADWCATFLSAVFKKGDPAELDNYRGIAVGSCIGKVFSLVLHARLSQWSESQGLRAAGQAGFRDGFRSSDHVFVLKHLVDRCRAPGSQHGKLYACFVDFRKAYDLVHRDLLLRCLTDLGVRGKMLGALASMYWRAPMTVKNGATLGATFNSTRGVKQGDPLSPLLFGLFIDRFERWLAERLPDTGVQLGAQLVRLLLYADDLTLLASSASELQALLDALHEFSTQNSLQVNVAKCAVVVFGKSAPRPGADTPAGGWTYAGEPVPLVPEFRYLGINFHQTRGVTACTSALRSAGLRAMWGMLSKCGAAGIRSVEVKVQLFDALVSPVLGYCSEVWAPTLLRLCRDPDACMDNELHRVQSLFMRQVLGGLRRSTLRQLMLRELGWAPMVRAWLQSMLALWNRMADLPEASLLGAALQDNISLAASAQVGWYHDFCGFVERVGCAPEGGLEEAGVLTKVYVPSALRLFDSWFYSCWQDLPDSPRTAPPDVVSCCTYQQWFAREGGPLADPLTLLDRGRWSDPPGYVRWSACMPRSKLRALACFRVGAHDLEVQTLKWQGVPREDRLCTLCGSGVGDELHMVTECVHYAAVRQRHHLLFDCLGGWQHVVERSVSPAEFRQFMCQEQHLVAAFLYECSQRRWQNPPAELLEVVDGGELAASEDEAIIDAVHGNLLDLFPDDLLDDL